MRRGMFLTVLLIVVMACATPQGTDRDLDGLRDSPSGRYGGALGDSPVGVIPEIELRDESRNRTYEIAIEYPTHGSNLPVLIFSPGFGGSNRSYVGLSSSWTSNGYVVIRTSHADSNSPRLPHRESAADLWASQTKADWRNRVRDVTYVIDSLDALEQRYPELQGKMDKSKIGVGGHSYGAFTAMLLGGVKTFPGGESYADSRVKAIVAMSPQGPSEIRGLTRESYASLGVPALFMVGSMDFGVTDAETPEWRREAFTLAPNGDKWLLMLQGARHASFTGRLEDVMRSNAFEPDPVFSDPTRVTPRTASLSRPSMVLSVNERSVFNRIKGLSLAFWDAALKGDAKGREALENPGVGVSMEKK